MQLRIGIVQARELEIMLADDAKLKDVRAQIDSALSEGTALWFTDREGNETCVPADKVAHLTIEPAKGRGPIGFAAE